LKRRSIGRKKRNQRRLVQDQGGGWIPARDHRLLGREFVEDQSIGSAARGMKAGPQPRTTGRHQVRNVRLAGNRTGSRLTIKREELERDMGKLFLQEIQHSVALV
jgi:hypothetical protein